MSESLAECCANSFPLTGTFSIPGSERIAIICTTCRTCAFGQTEGEARTAWNRRQSGLKETDQLSKSYQERVQDWIIECFGAAIAADGTERSHRFLEEALELAQACGATAKDAHMLVDYVFGRPVGEKAQEVGGVLVTLAALCSTHRIDMSASGEVELARVWTKIEAIRAKWAAKPKNSPLPQRA